MFEKYLEQCLTHGRHSMSHRELGSKSNALKTAYSFDYTALHSQVRKKEESKRKTSVVMDPLDN